MSYKIVTLSPEDETKLMFCQQMYPTIRLQYDQMETAMKLFIILCRKEGALPAELTDLIKHNYIDVIREDIHSEYL